MLESLGLAWLSLVWQALFNFGTNLWVDPLSSFTEFSGCGLILSELGTLGSPHAATFGKDNFGGLRFFGVAGRGEFWQRGLGVELGLLDGGRVCIKREAVEVLVRLNSDKS